MQCKHHSLHPGKLRHFAFRSLSKDHITRARTFNRITFTLSSFWTVLGPVFPALGCGKNGISTWEVGVAWQQRTMHKLR